MMHVRLGSRALAMKLVTQALSAEAIWSTASQGDIIIMNHGSLQQGSSARCRSQRGNTGSRVQLPVLAMRASTRSFQLPHPSRVAAGSTLPLPSAGVLMMACFTLACVSEIRSEAVAGYQILLHSTCVLPVPIT